MSYTSGGTSVRVEPFYRLLHLTTRNAPTRLALYFEGGDVESMDPTSLALVKHGADLAEEAARGFLSKVLGSPLEEVGAMLHDKVRARRFRNQVNTLVKARDMLAEAGISPKSVPLKVLVPLLEGVSLEEESMTARWAALLANAASSPQQAPLTQTFMDILRILSPIEAHIFDAIYDISEQASRGKPRLWRMTSPDNSDQIVYYVSSDSIPTRHGNRMASEITESMMPDLQDWQGTRVHLKMASLLPHDLDLDLVRLLFGNLARLQIISTSGFNGSGIVNGRSVNIEIEEFGDTSVTPLGVAFAKACQPPQSTAL